MADGPGQQDLKGIDIQKFVTGFDDEDVILKKFCRQSKTTAREVRWFQKTAGYISPLTTTGITKNFLVSVAPRAIAPVARQTWTRNTSYVLKYYHKSETISIEDEKDTDVDVLMTMVRDLLIGVASQVDTSIYDIGTNTSNILTGQTDGTMQLLEIQS